MGPSKRFTGGPEWREKPDGLYPSTIDWVSCPETGAPEYGMLTLPVSVHSGSREFLTNDPTRLVPSSAVTVDPVSSPRLGYSGRLSRKRRKRRYLPSRDRKVPLPWRTCGSGSKTVLRTPTFIRKPRQSPNPRLRLPGHFDSHPRTSERVFVGDGGSTLRWDPPCRGKGRVSLRDTPRVVSKVTEASFRTLIERPYLGILCVVVTGAGELVERLGVTDTKLLVNSTSRSGETRDLKRGNFF